MDLADRHARHADPGLPPCHHGRRRARRRSRGLRGSGPLVGRPRWWLRPSAVAARRRPRCAHHDPALPRHDSGAAHAGGARAGGAHRCSALAVRAGHGLAREHRVVAAAGQQPDEPAPGQQARLVREPVRRSDVGPGPGRARRVGGRAGVAAQDQPARDVPAGGLGRRTRPAALRHGGRGVRDRRSLVRPRGAAVGGGRRRLTRAGGGLRAPAPTTSFGSGCCPGGWS